MAFLRKPDGSGALHATTPKTTLLMETQLAPSPTQAGTGQGNYSGKTTPESVVGNQQVSVEQTGANSTVLGGSFNELKDDPKAPEIPQPSPPSIPGVNQPEIPKPEIEPQVDKPEIQEPLGDEGYAQKDGDKDDSTQAERTNQNGKTGYNEAPMDAPLQQREQLDSPSGIESPGAGSEETEDYPR